MTDVYLLLTAVLIAVAGLAVAVAVIRAGRRRQALARRRRPARLRSELRDIENYIRRVNQAAADEELDRLEEEGDGK